MSRALVLFFLVTGCFSERTVMEELDLLGFRLWGRALLSDTNFVRLKEVHLNNDVLRGKPVIVMGKLQEIGTHSTYLVLVDNSAKLVVKLTDLASSVRQGLTSEVGQLKVFGVVDINSRGHPFILAKAVRPTASS